MIPLKTDREIQLMREANRVVAIILQEVADRIRPGVSTQDLDVWAEERVLSLKAIPAFKGYGGSNRRPAFPATLCISINEEVVHGIPAPERILREGDIVGIDIGVVRREYYGDGAWTYPVGQISVAVQNLLKTCQEALLLGVAQAKAGNHIGDISLAIDRHVRAQNYEIVRDLSGHGIGRNLHEDPPIPNYYAGQKGRQLKKRMTLAIEPMITAGMYQVRTLDDQWTVVTADGSLSAHFEHTVLVDDGAAEILTRV